MVEVRTPATVLWGDLDVPCVVEDSRVIAGMLPGSVARVLPGVAHLPYVE
ncbi:MAG TPA: hypothetical protein VIJ51_02175 [Solirubrobacteraceae bacterium]